jgi:hypothetical protein
MEVIIDICSAGFPLIAFKLGGLLTADLSHEKQEYIR